MPPERGPQRGSTLIELVVTVLIFSVLSTIMYSTFNMVMKQVSLVGAGNSLADKGQRILSYLEEDIHSIGFLLGPDAQVPYCPGADNGTGTPLPSRSATLSHTSGNPYDSLTFLTARPIELSEAPECRNLFVPGGAGTQKDCSSGDPFGANNDRIDYYLSTRCDSAAGELSVGVNAGASCYQGIAVGENPFKNGRSLVTFDSLRLSSSSVAGSSSQLYYTLASTGATLILKERLEQNVPDNSAVYGVRMYRYLVVGRSLKRIGWDQGCDCGPDVSSDLVPVSNPEGTSGGVDGVKFEFTFLDPVSNALVTRGTPPPLSELKTVTVWLLLRSDKKDLSYTDRGTYALGSTTERLTLGPYHDHYRRQLLRKTVEVKNLESSN